MKFYDDPIPKKRKRKRDNKKPKSDQANTDPSEDERNYGLERLNLITTAQEFESEY